VFASGRYGYVYGLIMRIGVDVDAVAGRTQSDRQFAADSRQGAVDGRSKLPLSGLLVRLRRLGRCRG
jgi:hypothetical protein